MSAPRCFHSHARRRRVLSCAAALLVAASASAAAAEAAPQDPCALLDAADYARVFPAAGGALESKPYVGRRSAECLWTDAQGQRSLRLVLYPTKDAARPLAQLERQRIADPQALSLDVDGLPALHSGDRSQLSVAVGPMLLSLIGSAPLPPVAAQALASKVIAQVHGAEVQP
ncbi:hypothetical protein [Aquimonas voraii]|uniref:DUF3558 domain-containing protein n=1 Tax=Aquimonas voraii TaxID=265719 RepID=A0A1G6U2F2_9GAMM|nr:hypothetical protein [Aquimonas voraii]SDD35529.1 hypothetical protein SAMN04488509_102130 [Aquimonas voraii]